MLTLRLFTIGNKNLIIHLKTLLIYSSKLTMVCNNPKQLKASSNMLKRTFCLTRKKTGMKSCTGGEMHSESMKINNLKNPITLAL